MTLWLKGMLAAALVCGVAGRAAETPQVGTAVNAATERWAAHLKELKPKIPAGFTMVVSAPFVVIGNSEPDTVRMFSRQTVQWSVESLKKAYFQKDPNEIIDIWLFKDAATYNYYAKKLFNDTPTTPYGYYSSQHKALIMNIGTGGGTLVHEIVHPFMDTNFPECPPWFNEGLASLYEQSGQDRKGIKGLTNWRLAGLQDVINAGGLPSFADLMALDARKFYGKGSGTHYAQSRYLCYYLQENDLLNKFYHEFVANQKDDPTGYKTLTKLLGEKDMKAFQQRWEKYVLSLKFP
jgi:hypothetical protein